MVEVHALPILGEWVGSGERAGTFTMIIHVCAIANEKLQFLRIKIEEKCNFFRGRWVEICILGSFIPC